MQIIRYLKILIIILLSLPFLVGLILSIVLNIDAVYSDLSTEKSYKDLIGQKFLTLKPMTIHGVSSGNTNYQEIEYYGVRVEPISGYEIESTEVLDSGTIFEIQSVSYCSNCLDRLFDRQQYVLEITILSVDKYNYFKIYMTLYFDPPDVPNSYNPFDRSGDTLILNKERFSSFKS